MTALPKTSKDLYFTTLYYQRREFAYCLNPNVDWTNPEKQTAWKSYGKRVGRFLSEEYPLTRDELTVLCRAYAVQHDEPENKSLRTYDLEYELLALFENGIVIVTEWWPFEY